MSKSKRLPKGTKVVITDNGQHYDSYKDMAQWLKLKNWKRDPRVRKGDKGTVLSTRKHEYNYDICYGIVLEDGTEVIMGGKGIEAIGYEKPKPQPKTPAKEAVAKLKKLQESDDFESTHGAADKILCDLLESLGHKDVVDAWRKVGKYYA